MADYVEACREGNARPDSVLEPPATPEQVALARTTAQLNDTAFHLYGEWMLEKFREKLRESFPLMR
ncbi:MAG: hypothetical protein U0167_06140 [bacterium]